MEVGEGRGGGRGTWRRTGRTLGHLSLTCGLVHVWQNRKGPADWSRTGKVARDRQTGRGQEKLQGAGRLDEDRQSCKGPAGWTLAASIVISNTIRSAGGCSRFALSPAF